LTTSLAAELSLLAAELSLSAAGSERTVFLFLVCLLPWNTLFASALLVIFICHI
jgi:hypothetical protein